MIADVTKVRIVEDVVYRELEGEMVLLNPDMVRGAHATGRTVFAWWLTADTAVTNAVLDAYGVDGIMVDDARPADRP